jgi:hypothetical protein
MKRVLIVIALMTGFLVNAQKMTREFLQGIWIPETYASELTFEGTAKSLFKVTMVTGDVDREPLKIIGYQFKKNNFYLESYYEQNDWRCIGKFTIIDQNTMVVDYVSQASAVVVYRRKQE